MMSRIVAIGLTALILTACGPADQASTPEPAVPAPAPVAVSAPAASASPVSAAPPSAPMSWEAMQDHYAQMESAPTDPLEALEYRAVICSHLSGEFGGEDPERERNLSNTYDELRCGDQLVIAARYMREERAGDPVAVARLNTILAELA